METHNHHTSALGPLFWFWDHAQSAPLWILGWMEFLERVVQSRTFAAAIFTLGIYLCSLFASLYRYILVFTHQKLSQRFLEYSER